MPQVPPYALVLMSVTSYRIHSIFVLRCLASSTTSTSSIITTSSVTKSPVRLNWPFGKIARFLPVFCPFFLKMLPIFCDFGAGVPFVRYSAFS